MATLRHKWRLALLIVVACFAAALLSLPLWFPLALRPLARSLHLNFSSYERNGYSRFRIHHVVLNTGAGKLRAETADAYVPTVWLWKTLTGATRDPFLNVHSWEFRFQPSTHTQTSSTYTNLTALTLQWNRYKKFVPNLLLTGGRLELDTWTVAVPKITGIRGRLFAQLALPNSVPIELEANSTQKGRLTLKLESKPLELQGRWLARETGGQLAVTGTIVWLTNSIDMHAEFPRTGALPETAGVRADAFAIPARALDIPQYRDLAGSLNASWSTNAFRVDLTAKAAPRSEQLPPITLDVHASGDRAAARIDVASISTPWLEAELSRRTAVLFHPPYLEAPATLNVRADLGQQHWIPAKGRLEGSALLRPGRGPFPQATVSLAGSGIDVASIATKSLHVEAASDWPRFELSEAKLTMADGSAFTLAGSYDARTKAVEGGRLEFSGPFGARWLPPGYSYRTASILAQFHGPLETMTNSATVQIADFQAPGLQPIQVHAGVGGRGLDLQQIQLKLDAADASVRLAGSADLAQVEKKIELTTLELSRTNRLELELHAPARIDFGRGASPSSWRLAIQSIHCTGPDRELNLEADVSWPRSGTFQGSARGLDGALVGPFIRGELAGTRLNSLSFSGAWTNGPVRFNLESEAQLEARHTPFQAQALATGGSKGIVIQHFSLTTATQSVCTVEGSLPLLLEPATTNDFIHIIPDGALQLRAHTEPGSLLWEKLAESTGLVIDHPRLVADLTGTWADPRGRVTLQLDRLQFPKGKHPTPSVEHLDLDASFARGSARVTALKALVEGQAIQLEGETSLPRNYWRNLLDRQYLPDWRNATAHLTIPSAQLKPLALFLPTILSPEGSVQADIHLAAGGMLNGELTVSGAATRPLADIGPVRDIRARLLFTGRTVQLTNGSASIGGQKVLLSGRTELDENTWRKTGVPPFEARLRGIDVPLVRQPALVMRADLDLAATNRPGVTPTISGTVSLRDSLFMADLKSLAPERAESPKQHPPYFSVDTPPWADWQLKINVKGNGFMRVQTPLFDGKVSTTLSLQGPLKSPLALGDVKIGSGEVTFPFGSLDVNQGFVSLTSENPYHPQLYVTATAQRYGYDIKMEVTGPADAPVVQFTSTPPLGSEQIVLMLTTGQLPPSAGFTTSTRERAQGLALFFGKNLLTDLGFGGGSQERLTVRSGEQISETGRPTYQVEYKLTKHWSLIGEYDRFDQFNVNLKWGVYSK